MPDLGTEIPIPRDNPFLYGHEQAQKIFLQAAGNQKLPHAFLIRGPEGIGKATLAYCFRAFYPGLWK